MARIILGIETSCDETAAAVYHEEKGLLSSEIYSSIALHQPFGGVVPEIASRAQLEKINCIIELALDTAQVSLSDITTVAITTKPGLPGSLLVGLCFGKALAWATGKELIGVNHLEGHIFSSCIENSVPFPHLCISASGGHTGLYLVTDYGEYTLLGYSLDDAAGEAFDKIAKLMNLGYPGGPLIEKMARSVQFEDFFNYPRGKNQNVNFSFSGLKTAVLYDLVKRDAYDLQNKKFLKDTDRRFQEQVASSLLNAISDIFCQKVTAALHQHPEVKALTFVGGVACNSFIKNNLKAIADKNNIQFFSPSPAYCTDNAAMIALVGNYKAKQGHFSGMNLDILV